MATVNTLTDLTPDLFAKLDVVSHELIGLIPAISRDGGVERAAKDQVVRSFVAPDVTASDLTPGQLAANSGGQTFANKTITIDKVRKVEILWNGEEQQGMNHGPQYRNMLLDQFEQGFRTLANEIEADLAAKYVEASNAVVPAGTLLFDAANYSDAANANRELNLNGAPQGNRSLILSNAAAARFRGNAQYTGANTAGNEAMLRQGVMLDQFGMMIRESNQINDVAKGTGASATTDNAGYAIGATVLTLASAGTGTIVAGDALTFAGDANVYVVASGDADVSNGGTITLAAPGLRVAMSAATKAITVVDGSERNMAFSKNAIHLATRLPARPMEGDLSRNAVIVQDPRSGLAFEIAQYEMYHQVKFEIAIAYGIAVIKPEHLVLLVD
jgi:hypothetical protein